MRSDYEQQIALECLRLADGHVARAEELLAFVTGRDADDARKKLEVVREAVS